MFCKQFCLIASRFKITGHRNSDNNLESDCMLFAAFREPELVLNEELKTAKSIEPLNVSDVTQSILELICIEL
jgi:hypothetical protein